MKKDIHPEFYTSATVRCNGCGTTFQTGSVMKELNLTICSSCHPHYTGQQRFVDTAGRVDRFKKKYGDKSVFAAKA